MAQDASLELAAAMMEVGDDDVTFLRLLEEYHAKYRAHAILSISLRGVYSFSDAGSVDMLVAAYAKNLPLLQQHRVLIQAGIRQVLATE